MFHVFCVLCLMLPVLCLLSHVYFSHVSYLTSPVSRLLSHVFCLIVQSEDEVLATEGIEDKVVANRVIEDEVVAT